MRRTLTLFLAVLLVSPSVLAMQNGNSNTASTQGSARSNTNRRRGPVFRANKEQVKQAQGILRQRGFYGGTETGKLDADTREGLKKYQAAEQLKVTGTLNKITLEKMNIQLTDKQKAM
jgi:peptidoglycan hydrolase-like protein with peptidoglycan-binding domain